MPLTRPVMIFLPGRNRSQEPSELLLWFCTSSLRALEIVCSHQCPLETMTTFDQWRGAARPRMVSRKKHFESNLGFKEEDEVAARVTYIHQSVC